MELLCDFPSEVVTCSTREGFWPTLFTAEQGLALSWHSWLASSIHLNCNGCKSNYPKVLTQHTIMTHLSGHSDSGFFSFFGFLAGPSSDFLQELMLLRDYSRLPSLLILSIFLGNSSSFMRISMLRMSPWPQGHAELWQLTPSSTAPKHLLPHRPMPSSGMALPATKAHAKQPGLTQPSAHSPRVNCDLSAWLSDCSQIHADHAVSTATTTLIFPRLS